MKESLHNTHTNFFQPQGAYAELRALQQLRYLAQPLAAVKNVARSSASSGKHRSRALSRGMEFEEVRLYQPGDDVRNIDWRVTARTQTTHTKRYRDEKEKPVITLVDQRRSTFFGSQQCFKSVYACHLAALINWSSLKRGDRAGGLVIGTQTIDEVRPARSHQNVNRWLQLLTQTNHQLTAQSTHTEPRLADGLKKLLRIAPSGTDCALITDAYDLDDECEKILFQLARHNHISLYWVFDNLEKELPIIHDITFSNGQQKSTLNIDKHQQQQHQHYFLQKQEHVQALCQRYKIPLLMVNTKQIFMEWVTGKPAGASYGA
jgi:uncharacterized protein (DUF58 family)